jgi:hypothetical protein
MAFKLEAPVVQTFILEKTDTNYGLEKGDEPTTVTLRKATQGQHEYRQQLFATLERRFNDLAPEQTSLVQTANTEELKRLETRLTLVDSNITKEDGKKPLFLSKKGKDGLPELSMDKRGFDEAWALLPPDVAAEIHEKVLELNPMWGPRGG